MKHFHRAVLTRFAQSYACSSLALRGSLCLAGAIGFDKRTAQDLDFLALYDYEPQRTTIEFEEILSIDLDDGVKFPAQAMVVEPTWQETEFPGLRLHFEGHFRDSIESLSIDIGFGDPLATGPILTTFSELPDYEFLTPDMETQFAWKLHGLVEKSDNVWTPKTLNDLWLMLNYVDLDEQRLIQALKLAFESRDSPFWRLDRLLANEFGRSQRNHKRWRKFVLENDGETAPDIATARAALIDQLQPIWSQLRTHGPVQWPANLSLSEVTESLEELRQFRSYKWNDGLVFSYERQSSETFPEPLLAATNKLYRQRQIFREARGLTFSATGKVIARPIPKFFNLDPDDSIDSEALVVEKLDGSLVFPTPLTDEDPQWRLRTRRGQSSISQAAHAFVESKKSKEPSPIDLIDWCLANQLTPCFEWCSRQRIIVLDHPDDRLVLFEVRDNITGELWGYQRCADLARRFNTEMVQYLGQYQDCDWRSEIQGWENAEGCVIQSGQQRFKLKSARYKLFHSALEGPAVDRARWKLILAGDESLLNKRSELRGESLRDYCAGVHSALSKLQDTIAELVTQHRERRTFAQAIDDWPRELRKAAFAIYSGADAASVIARSMEQLLSSTRALREFAQKMKAPFAGLD